MTQPAIVKIIQRCETWGDVRSDGMGNVYVPVFFDTHKDAEAFKVELMMVASGQEPYAKNAPDGEIASTEKK